MSIQLFYRNSLVKKLKVIVLCQRAIALVQVILVLSLFLISSRAAADQEDPGEVLIGNELRDIAMDADYVWIATDKGVNRYDRNADKWKFYTIADGLINNQVNCIEPERVEGILTTRTGNEVWFGTDSGVSVYDKAADSWKSYTTRDGLIHNKVNAISARGDDVWIGTDKGVSVYDKKDGKWMSYSEFPGIPTSEVTSIYHQAAYAWVGTQQGMARYNYMYRKWEYFTNRRGAGSSWLSPEGGQRKTDDSPVPDDRINAIDGEGRYVYIATKSALVEYDKNISVNYLTERNAYLKLGRARRSAVNSLYRPRMLGGSGARFQMTRDREEAWEGMGWRSMDISSLMGDKKYQVSDNFLDVKYRAGQAWVATNSGLVRFDSWVGQRQVFTKESGLIDSEVNAVATIGSEVWVGTSHGLSTYSQYSRSWKNFRMERALPSSYITTLAEDKGKMWFGTRGAVSSLDYQSERWKTYTRNEGLAGTNVKSIAVVGNYVWFGTDEGVSRLDKSTSGWDNFNAGRSGLVSNDVTSIMVDGKYIWVGTKSGLSRYDDTTEEWTTYSNILGLLDNQINALAADPGYVWVGTRSGLNRYDKESGEWTAYTTDDGLSNNVINSLAVAKDQVWAATRRGLNMMDLKAEQWTSYTDEPINAIAIEDNNRVWMGSRGSISYYDLATGEVRVFTDADVEGVSRVNVYGAQDTPLYVWFATDGGVYRYSKADGTWWIYSPTRQRGSTDTLADANVQTIAGDRDFIYFGTSSGISRYDRMTGNWLSYTVADGLIGPDVRSLLLDGPELWAGTQDGISCYDTVSDTWTSYTRKDGLPSDKVFSLALHNHRSNFFTKKFDQKTRRNECRIIWAGTHGGAAFLEEGESRWKEVTIADGLPDNHIWWIAVDNPYIWFGTNEGAARYDPENDLWMTYSVDDGLMNNVVLSIGFEEKYVFLNTPSGTTIYDKELGSFTPFSQADGLAGQTATSIGSMLPASKLAKVGTPNLMEQQVWIGTYGGVTQYDLVTDTVENITQNDGLASNRVQAIRFDEKYIWFGTDSGLSRYDTLSGEWITYGKAATSGREEQSSGLISYNIKSLGVDDNYLWVGTRAGLSRYDKINDLWEHFPLVLGPTEGLASSINESQDIGTVAEALIRDTMTKREPSLVKTEGQTPPTDTPSIRAIAIGGNSLWLGSDVGLYMYDKSLGELVWFTSDITGIRDIHLKGTKIWVVSDDEIAAFERGDTFNAWTIFSDGRVDEEVTSDKGVTSSKERDLTSSAGLTNLTKVIVDDDLLWLGRERGLRIYNTKSRKPVESIRIPEEISGKKITAMVSDNEHFWIGTRNGLYLHNRRSGTWDFFSESNGLASNYVSCLAIDDGYIWVGSSDRGVSRYDKSTSQWQTYSSSDGLADNNVRAIAVDGKYVWFGTFSGGVCRYDKTSELWTTHRSENYTGRPQT